MYWHWVMITSKARSKKWELSKYDIRSYLIQVVLVVGPFILASTNDISVLLEQWIGDPHTTAILMTTVALLIKKVLTDHEVTK